MTRRFGPAKSARVPVTCDTGLNVGQMRGARQRAGPGEIGAQKTSSDKPPVTRDTARNFGQSRGW